MKFTKMTDESEITNVPTISDMRMVRITFEFPVPKHYSFEGIESHLDELFGIYSENCTVEQSSVTVNDLVVWSEKVPYGDGVEFMFEDDYISLSEIIQNSKKKK